MMLFLVILVTGASPAFAQQDALGGGSRTAWNSIVGRVTDPGGKPVANVFVTVLQPTPPPQQSAEAVSPFIRTVTNEKGEYTLNKLPLGPLYVVAIPHNAPVDAKRDVNRVGLGPTYFPSAASLGDATAVTVDVSQPAHADIVLQRASLAVVTGSIVDANSRPLTKGTLIVAHGGTLDGLDTGTAPIHADGTFSIGGLTPGTYDISVREKGDTASMETTVVVSGKDVSNVRVTAAGGRQD